MASRLTTAAPPQIQCVAICSPLERLGPQPHHRSLALDHYWPRRSSALQSAIDLFEQLLSLSIAVDRLGFQDFLGRFRGQFSQGRLLIRFTLAGIGNDGLS